jgi:hypothetical protein
MPRQQRVKATIILAIFIVFGVGNAMATDIPRVKSIACKASGPKYYCRIDFNLSCTKGSVLDPLDPGRKRDTNLPYPPQRGFHFVPGTGHCVEQELKGKGYIHLLSFSPTKMQIEAGCEANRIDDAFVYGYCSAEGDPVVSGAGSKRKSR